LTDLIHQGISFELPDTILLDFNILHSGINDTECWDFQSWVFAVIKVTTPAPPYLKMLDYCTVYVVQTTFTTLHLALLPSFSSPDPGNEPLSVGTYILPFRRLLWKVSDWTSPAKCNKIFQTVETPALGLLGF